MIRVLISICCALFSAAVIILSVVFTHPNATVGNGLVVGIAIAVPAILSMLWALLPLRVRPASSLLRKAILYYAGFGGGVLLCSAVLGLAFSGSGSLTWVTVAGFMSPFLFVVAALVGVATPLQPSEAGVHAVAFRLATGIPVAIGLAFHLGYAFYFQNRIQTVAGGKPYCVGVYDSDGGREFYRPATFYDFTYLSLRMDEVSTGNGSYRPGYLLVMEIGRGKEREIVIYDERDQTFYSRGNDPGDGFIVPRAEVQGCILR